MNGLHVSTPPLEVELRKSLFGKWRSDRFYTKDSKGKWGAW